MFQKAKGVHCCISLATVSILDCGVWHNSAQNRFLHSHGNNDYVYLPYCYVARTLPVVLRVIFIVLPWMECLWNFYMDFLSFRFL